MSMSISSLPLSPTMRFFIFFYLLFIFYFTSEAVNCITLPNISKTTTLNVQALTQNSQNVFSFNYPQTTPKFNQLEVESLPSFSSSLSLSLHSRVSLHKPTQINYKSLTLARLERDSDRVRSLTARLDLALNRITNSELKPLNTSINGSDLEAEKIQAPVISGTSQGSGEYFCQVAIGKPPTPAYLVLDTGSDVSWVQCAPCAGCYQQADPIFKPTTSSSYSPLSCETPQCKLLDVSECRNGTCLYQVSYGDGSYTVGDFITETITLGSSSVKDIAMGCGHNNEGLFIGAAGLLGLGGGPLSFPSQLNTTTFSYCLVDRDSDSASTLEFDLSLPRNDVTAPLRRNPELSTFFYVGMTGLSVGGELLSLSETAFKLDENGNGGVIIDSGTAVTRLQTDTYNALRKAFVNGTKHLTSTNGVALFETCYNLSRNTSVEVPTVALHFPEGKMLPLPAKNYLIPIDSVGTYCFAFAPTTSTLSIIGNVQQQGIRVGFDLANSLVGFSPNNC